MTITFQPSSDSVLGIPEGQPYLLTVEDFYRMIDADIFPEESRVGLWDGWIYEKMAKKQAHAVSGSKSTYTLIRLLPPGWFLSGENPITIGPRRAPLPDLVVLRGIPDDYIDRRPEVADVGLVVELSDSSLRIDTGVKLAGYASAGIPTYWVLNLVDGVVQVYESPIPAEGRYASERVYRRGESIPLALDGLVAFQVDASDLLPAH